MQSNATSLDFPTGFTLYPTSKTSPYFSIGVDREGGGFYSNAPVTIEVIKDLQVGVIFIREGELTVQDKLVTFNKGCRALCSEIVFKKIMNTKPENPNLLNIDQLLISRSVKCELISKNGTILRNTLHETVLAKDILQIIPSGYLLQPFDSGAIKLIIPEGITIDNANGEIIEDEKLKIGVVRVTKGKIEFQDGMITFLGCTSFCSPKFYEAVKNIGPAGISSSLIHKEIILNKDVPCTKITVRDF